MNLSIYEQIVNRMVSYCNKTLDDLKNDPEFYYKNKLTNDQYFEWYNWSLNLLYQTFPNRKQEDIKKEFDFFDITRGLLYIYERPVTIWTEEEESLFNGIKQKRIGKDNTLKEL